MGMGPNFVLDKGMLATGGSVAYKRGEIVVPTAGSDGQSVARAITGTNVTIATNLEPFYVNMEDIDAVRVATGKAVIDIRILGIARVLAGATFARASRLVPDATARAVAQTRAAAGAQPVPILGIALKAATVVNQEIEVLLTPGVTW